MEVQGKLRPKWEMDTFFCSHRCTSDVRLLVRGVWVLLTPARRASKLLSALLTTSALTINLLLRRSQTVDIRRRPEPISGGSDQSWMRSVHLSHCYPSVYRSQADSRALGSFGSSELPINHEQPISSFNVCQAKTCSGLWLRPGFSTLLYSV